MQHPIQVCECHNIILASVVSRRRRRDNTIAVDVDGRYLVGDAVKQELSVADVSQRVGVASDPGQCDGRQSSAPVARQLFDGVTERSRNDARDLFRPDDRVPRHVCNRNDEFMYGILN